MVLPHLGDVDQEVRLGRDVSTVAQWPLAPIKLFAALYIIKGSNLHVSKQGDHLQVKEHFVESFQPDLLFLVEFVY